VFEIPTKNIYSKIVSKTIINKKPPIKPKVTAGLLQAVRCDSGINSL